MSWIAKIHNCWQCAVVLLTVVIIIPCDCVVIREDAITRVDPGGNVMVTWAVNVPEAFLDFDYVRVNKDSATVLNCTSGLVHCEFFNRSSTQHAIYIISNITDIIQNATINANVNVTVTIGLGIDNVGTPDAGSYELTYSIDNYEETKHHIVYVYQKPIILDIYNNVDGAVREGGSKRYICRASTRSLPQIYATNTSLVTTWVINGLNDNHNTSEYEFTSVSRTHNNYSIVCVVRDGQSRLSATSDVKRLIVTYVGSVIFTDDGEGHVTCAAECNPPCTYEWLDNTGRNITNPFLTANAYTGNITCLAKNKDGSKSSSLYVLIASSNINEPTPVFIILGAILAVCVIVVIVLSIIVALACRRVKHKADENQNQPEISAKVMGRPMTTYDQIPDDAIPDDTRYTPPPFKQVEIQVADQTLYLTPTDDKTPREHPYNRASTRYQINKSLSGVEPVRKYSLPNIDSVERRKKIRQTPSDRIMSQYPPLQS